MAMEGGIASDSASPQFGEVEESARQDTSSVRTAPVLTEPPPTTLVSTCLPFVKVNGTDTGEQTSVPGPPTQPSTQGGQTKLVVGVGKATASHASSDEPRPDTDAKKQHAQATSEVTEPPTMFVGQKGVVNAKKKENKKKEQELDTKEKIQTILQKLHARGRWNEQEGFVSVCDESNKKDILKFLHLATIPNYRGVFIDYCVCCGCRKKVVKTKVPKSHIWPEGVLRIMQQVYYRDQKEFILNLTDGRRMGAAGLTAKLLCCNCENGDSKDEQRFRNLYLELLSMEGGRELQVSNERNWLKRTLVKIMFLGLVINTILPDGDRYDQVFINLWRYYRFGDSPIDIRLFLLPSKPFVPISELSPLERALRNICFTSLVRKGEEEFLYTQCDIFHVVLPISKESRKLFDCYYNCFLGSTEKAVILRPTCNIRHGFEKARVSSEHSAHRGTPTFPTILKEENDQRIPELKRKTSAILQKDYRKEDYVPVTLFPGRPTKYPHEIPLSEYPRPTLPVQCTSAATESDEIFNPSRYANDK